MKKQQYSEIFVFISIIFVSCILISNILASKIINVFGISMTSGVLVFPISYVLGDVMTEIYGYEKTKKVIIYGFISNLLMVIAFYLAMKLPYPDYWQNQEAFIAILSNTPRVLLASFIGYLIGGLSNSYIMEYIKNNSKIKFLWFRTILSTIVGEALDTTIFLTISFIGTMNGYDLISMIIYQSIFKIMYEVVLTPILYKVVDFISNKEKKCGYRTT